MSCEQRNWSQGMNVILKRLKDASLVTSCLIFIKKIMWFSFRGVVMNQPCDYRQVVISKQLLSPVKIRKKKGMRGVCVCGEVFCSIKCWLTGLPRSKYFYKYIIYYKGSFSRGRQTNVLAMGALWPLQAQLSFLRYFLSVWLNSVILQPSLN